MKSSPTRIFTNYDTYPEAWQALKRGSGLACCRTACLDLLKRKAAQHGRRLFCLPAGPGITIAWLIPMPAQAAGKGPCKKEKENMAKGIYVGLETSVSAAAENQNEAKDVCRERRGEKRGERPAFALRATARQARRDEAPQDARAKAACRAVAPRHATAKAEIEKMVSEAWEEYRESCPEEGRHLMPEGPPITWSQAFVMGWHAGRRHFMAEIWQLAAEKSAASEG